MINKEPTKECVIYGNKQLYLKVLGFLYLGSYPFIKVMVYKIYPNKRDFK